MIPKYIKHFKYFTSYEAAFHDIVFMQKNGWDWICERQELMFDRLVIVNEYEKFDNR